jgi:hypothetical protein
MDFWVNLSGIITNLVSEALVEFGAWAWDFFKKSRMFSKRELPGIL